MFVPPCPARTAQLAGCLPAQGLSLQFWQINKNSGWKDLYKTTGLWATTQLGTNPWVQLLGRVRAVTQGHGLSSALDESHTLGSIPRDHPDVQSHPAAQFWGYSCVGKSAVNAITSWLTHAPANSWVKQREFHESWHLQKKGRRKVCL